MLINLILAANASNLTNVSNVTGNITSALNATGGVISSLTSNWTLLAGAFVMLVAAFVVLFVFKQVIANAVIGIIALLLIKYVFNVPIPLTPLVMLVSVLGGLGGVAAVLIATYFNWLQ